MDSKDNGTQRFCVNCKHYTARAIPECAAPGHGWRNMVTGAWHQWSCDSARQMTTVCGPAGKLYEPVDAYAFNDGPVS